MLCIHTHTVVEKLKVRVRLHLKYIKYLTTNSATILDWRAALFSTAAETKTTLHEDMIITKTTKNEYRTLILYVEAYTNDN